MHRNCRTHPDNFCYVCGHFCVKSQRRPITNQLKNIYKLYFECPLGDQDKSWAPHVICTSCSSGLRDWLNKRKVSMPFAIPVVWRKQKNHLDDCYFFLIDITGFSAKNKHALLQQIKIGSDMVEDVHADSTDANYVPEDELLEPQTFPQGELNDLVRNLDLSKDKAELLASRLKQKNLLDKDVDNTTSIGVYL
ncbi:hypothetical protein LOD99_3131 [Oopsacas minuta]|uniref:Uncharacterized protein n=1 Tax=Oopsacas minuta TaxID=111878 RepID=A0AAV7JYP9_9METZ|nr:hypothetical protein LOD99_3131 [Oopsacas minuta]